MPDRKRKPSGKCNQSSDLLENLFESQPRRIWKLNNLEHLNFHGIGIMQKVPCFLPPETEVSAYFSIRANFPLLEASRKAGKGKRGRRQVKTGNGVVSTFRTRQQRAEGTRVWLRWTRCLSSAQASRSPRQRKNETKILRSGQKTTKMEKNSRPAA